MAYFSCDSFGFVAQRDGFGSRTFRRYNLPILGESDMNRTHKISLWMRIHTLVAVISCAVDFAVLYIRAGMTKAIAGLLLLAIMLPVCGAAPSSSTSELLQQGLYAEEVEGNIDAAIENYQKVIDNTSAPRNHVAQALYRQGMCYLKTRDEQSAKAALEKLVKDYADQTEIVEKATPVLDDLMDFDPASLMPPDTLVYIELGSPGKQVETILEMLKGTPFENPLSAIGGGSAATGQGQKSPGDIMAALLNPSMMAEFKKIRGSAVGITGIAQNNPPMIIALYPGKSDALRGMILAFLGTAGQSAEAIEGMQTINIQNMAMAAYDDRVILIAQPAEQLQWCIKQYKGLISEPTLASTNPSFAKISKKQRQNNAFTAWMDVDEVFAKVMQMFPRGQVPQQVMWANTLVDFAHIDYITISSSIESDSFIDRYEVAFKEGHQCLAYDLIRTPNISKSALQAVPPDAVAIASFALSSSDMQADTMRSQIKNITGLDIGREIFANVEQVTIFAMPSRQSTPFFPACMGLTVTSHNPQQTQQILTKVLGSANTMLSGQPADWNSLAAGRYQIGMVNNTPLFCHYQQTGSTAILSLNPDIVQAAAAAVKNNKSVSTSGPLTEAISKLPPSASKLALVNVGGTIRLAAPLVIESFAEADRETLKDNFKQLEIACDKTTYELRTDERLNSLTVNSKLAGLPPLSQVFGPVSQIVQIVKKAKERAAAEEAKRQEAIAVRPAAVSPVIDGVEDDVWSAADRIKLTNVSGAPVSSPNDLSADFKIMWDKDNLYLFANVTDDILKNDAGEEWENDAVEVFIDADNSKDKSYGQNDYQFVFVWDKTSPRIREVKHDNAKGVQFAFVTTDTGYRAEFKFPWSTLGTTPHAGSKIGLDVHVADNDKGGKRDRKLIWHDKNDDAWQNPRVFANAELAGLLGWWKFDETEGSTAADSSGCGNSGSLQGNPEWKPKGGKIGGAIELDGSGDFITIENEPAFDIKNQITISAWVNITSVPQEWTGIVTKGDDAWRLSTDFANNVFHFGLAGSGDYLNGKGSVGSGQWHNVGCVYDGSTMSIYVDGKLDTSRPRSGPIGTNDFPVCIGDNLELPGRCWDGLIDDVRVYNYALSEKEIAALAAAQ